jgi:ribose 5-phosphate isomerase B
MFFRPLLQSGYDLQSKKKRKTAPTPSANSLSAQNTSDLSENSLHRGRRNRSGECKFINPTLQLIAMEPLVLGADHRGFELKEALKKTLAKRFEIIDVGTDSNQMVDFPDIVEKAVRQMKQAQSRAVLICGSGFGMSIAANKYKGIRAADCREELDAHYAREHNDANVLCMGSNFTNIDKAKRIVEVFLTTQFSHEERFTRRNKKIEEIENEK